MSEIIGYIIISKSEGMHTGYYALDRDYNDYPYWAVAVQFAHVFETKEEAISIINDKQFESYSKMDNGTLYPNRVVHSAMGLCKQKKSGSCTLSVHPMTIEDSIAEKTFYGEIKE